MKRFILAAALAGAATAFAQAPASMPAPAISVESPKPKCEDPPEYPGRLGMQTQDRRNRFFKAVESYKTCMLAFVEDRKAVIKAHEAAARSAIDAYNTWMKQLSDEQEKARE